MIRALGHAYLRWATRRRLDGVFVRGLDPTRALLRERPVLFVANHVSWWDGPLAVLAAPALDADARYLVDAANLARVPFLRWFGALDLDRATPLGPLGGLRSAAAWLDQPGHALWIFPQGRQRPASVRPLDLARGFTLLARRTDAVVVPVALVYGWRESHRPAAALSFGPPVDPTVEAVEHALTHEIDALIAWFDRPETALTPLIAPRRPLQEGAGARVLSLGAGRSA